MKTAFLDIDTERDFLYPSGALYVPGAERLVPTIARLNRYAAARGIPVLSTVDAHAENDPEFAAWPPHCVAGAWGQRKPESTLLDGRIVVPNVECAVALAGAPQFVIEKQTFDVFETVQFERILHALDVDDFVVYGVVTEVCVLLAVRGLLRLGKRVRVVRDAVAALTANGSDSAWAEMTAGGALAISLHSAEEIQNEIE